MKHETPSNLAFSLLHTLRLGTFQIGSAMGDILVTSIWNRVMITNFGIPAAPVGFLIALRYLLSPLSLWAGFLSDTRPLFGMRRTAYIWIGRGMMVLSLPLLGYSLVRFAVNTADALGWIAAAASSLLYGIGTLISGSPYLALVRDSAPQEKQGLAIGLVEIALISFFAISGIVFSLWMKVYDESIFWQMILGTILIGGFFWVFAIAGAENRREREGHIRPISSNRSREMGTGFRQAFGALWADQRTRGFFLFLSLATLSAWAQDAILEPFGAEVFDLPVERTTRLNSYWQATTVVTLVIGAYIWRKRPPESQGPVAGAGLSIMALGMALLGVASIGGQAHLIELTLLIFGAGFGIYTFGGVSLMAVMATDREAGIYLGLWSISVLVSKGVGTFLGSALRDLLLLNLGLSAATGYGAVFVLAAAGLAGSVITLSRLDVIGFAREKGRGASRVEAQIAGAD